MADTAQSGPKRILVVDDASLVRLYYREALIRVGYLVEEAFNGLEALEKLLLQPADMLIVDINMPKMDGLTFLKVLRRQAGEAATIPALVVSSEAGAQDRNAAWAAGANFYMTKPIAQDALLELVAMLCGPAA